MKEHTLDNSASEQDDVQTSPIEHHANSEPQPASRRISKSYIILTLAALFIAIAAAGSGFWVWLNVYHDITELENSTVLLSRRIEELNPKPELARLLDKLKADKASISNDISEQKKLIETLQKSVTKLFTNTSRTPREWYIAQSLHLVELANYRLQFIRDIDAAVIALQAADHIIEEAADPSLFYVREVLSADIDKLKYFKQPNLNVIKEKLDQLLKEHTYLPLSKPDTSNGQQIHLQETSDSQKDNHDSENLFHTLFQEINKHLIVKRHDKPVEALPSQQSQIYHYQILHLKLETIRIAVLNNDNNEYQKLLKSAVKWIDSHYSVSSTKELKKELEQLITINIAPPLPEITKSIEALNSILDTATFHVEGGAIQ